MTFERSFDYSLIGEIMRHPRLYQADDFSPAREDYRPPENESIYYMLVRDGEELLGLFVLYPQNAVCWEIHTRLLPCAWGARAAEAAKGILEWLWTNTPAVRLVTSAPGNNRLAIRFAEAGGLSRFGRNPASYLKNGKLHDQILLGISKPPGRNSETGNEQMSLVTSIIGGIQGASAAHNAANAIQNADQQAANTMQSAVTSGQGMVSTAGTNAGTLATNAAQNGQMGVAGAQQTAAALLNPYYSNGALASGQLANGFAPGGQFAQQFTAADMSSLDPGYQFRLQQGEQALQRSLTASGVGGGGAAKQLNDYAQNAASAEYQNAYSRFMGQQQFQVGSLQNLANAGQAAATTAGNQYLQAGEFNANLGENAAQYAGNVGLQSNEFNANLGMQGAQYIGNTMMRTGGAIADGDLGAASAWNGMLNGIGQAANGFFTGGLSGGGGFSNFNWNSALSRIFGGNVSGGGDSTPGQND
jgi:hypothetical protein